LKAVAVDTLAEYDFDLSRRMGDVLIRLRAIDSIPVMRATFRVLWPDAIQLHDSLADNTLWILNQRRHLIVHRRGVIDRDYIDKTGADVALGGELVVSASDVEAHVSAVIRAGSEMLRCAAPGVASANRS
jgi:hypothetical protein